eukprot:350796-Chlamydomonas_euryale.AAC.4
MPMQGQAAGQQREPQQRRGLSFGLPCGLQSFGRATRQAVGQQAAPPGRLSANARGHQAGCAPIGSATGQASMQQLSLAVWPLGSPASTSGRPTMPHVGGRASLSRQPGGSPAWLRRHAGADAAVSMSGALPTTRAQLCASGQETLPGPGRVRGAERVRGQGVRDSLNARSPGSAMGQDVRGAQEVHGPQKRTQEARVVEGAASTLSR